MNTEEPDLRPDTLNMRLQLLANVSNALVFCYNLRTEELCPLYNTDIFFGDNSDELVARIQAGECSSPDSLLVDFLHKKDWPVAFKACKELMRTGEMRCNLRFRRNGKWIWGQVCCRLEYASTGNAPVAVFGYIADIASGPIRSAIVDKFVYAVSDYFIYLDIPNNFFIRFSSSTPNPLFDGEDTNYAESIHYFIHNIVVEEDRAYASVQMQPGRIVEVLNKQAEHTFYLGMKDASGYRRKQLKYTYYDRDKQLVLLTRFDVTSVYEEEREYNRKLKEALALAQKDALTGLYNKTATEQLIKNVLSTYPEQTHVLMMLDIDNFKTINDNLGHMFGDAVLSEISLKLKRLFRNNDIVGRVGGDEFTVLMTDIDSAAVAIAKASEIVRMFQRSYTDNGRVWNISVSVGFTFTRGEYSFSELYQQADKALYTAKNKGKCGFHLYDDSEKYDIPEADAHQPVESISNSGARQVPHRFFEMLYSAVDMDSGVKMALSLLGELYNVSRVYVFEQDADRNTLSQTYEWCNKGIMSEKEQFQHISIGKLRYYNRFDANGVLHCPNMDDLSPVLRGKLTSQGVLSLLQVLVMDGREPRGFIGFDECSRYRLFTQHEIDNLTIVSKVLGTFILKKRFSDQRNAAIKAKIIALDYQPHSIYVVDDAFRIVYANKPLMRLIPSGGTSKKCYELFRKRTEPCPQCPVVDYAENQPAREIFNDFFNIWVQVAARRIPWEGVENATMLTCVNVTNTRRILQEPLQHADEAP